MTSTSIPLNQLPPVTPFLNSVCPGYTEHLDDNVHYKLEDVPQQTREIVYNSNTITLDQTYLNVARPSLNKKESTTYVSLPYHITNLFKKIVKNNEKGSEGYMQIGANVNPLTRDSSLSPSCMTRIAEFHKGNDKLNYGMKTQLKDLKDVKILKSVYDFDSCKLMISTHVNILNIFQLDRDDMFQNTQKIQTKSPIIPYTEETINTKVIEEPLLRVRFDNDLITALSVVNVKNECIVILGFQDGDILYLNLNDMKCQKFSYNKGVAISTLECIKYPNFEFFIVAGFTNGEVSIINPFGEKEEYLKKTSHKDPNILYFRRFNFNHQLVAHFKVSHKSVTSITSTLPMNKLISESQPLLLALASDDGFVRIIDLNLKVLTDIIPNYFNCGITNVKFSPDFKFLLLAGKGDLIEVLKMTYYNIGKSYPSMIKDIQIVTRLKSHINTVQNVVFLEQDSTNYKLMSSGCDGKILIWEFDYKALPKIKTEERVKKEAPPAPPSLNIDLPNPDVIKLYTSLYDLRLKRRDSKNSSIISPVIEDKYVPSIKTPLCTINLSCLIHDGKIESFHINESTLWCFGKNGDIFKYIIN